MLISHIVAAGKDGVIGIDNHLPWQVEGELARFKRLTLGRVVIMGRKTYQSLPKKLDDRRMIVLSKTIKQISGATIAHSLDDAFLHCKGETEVFIAGGAKVYAETLVFVDKIYYTAVESDAVGDAFYLADNLKNFACVFRQMHTTNYRYDYRTYVRCNRHR